MVCRPDASGVKEGQASALAVYGRSRGPDLHASDWHLVGAFDYRLVVPRVLELVAIAYGRFPTAGGYTRRALGNSVSFCLQWSRWTT